jgi:hypothetical protein
MKRNQDSIDDPWEIDIDLYIEKGMAPEWARALTINSWMLAGDLRPLRAELAEPKLDRAFLAHQVFGMLAKLIDQNRLTVKPSKGGRTQRGSCRGWRKEMKSPQHESEQRVKER